MGYLTNNPLSSPSTDEPLKAGGIEKGHHIAGRRLGRLARLISECKWVRLPPLPPLTKGVPIMDLEDLDKKTIIEISLAGIGVIILLICIFGAWFTVDAGEIGIVTRFGEVQRVAESGFNFKVPIIDGVTKMETRIQKEEVESSAVSKDLQEVNAKLALNYSINKETALKLYKEVGINYKDNIINPVLHESFKAGTAQYTAEDLITNRSEAKEKILEVVKDRLQPYGIVIADLNITNLDFSDAFNAAIEEKAVAQQQVEKAKQELEKVKIEAEQKIAKAKADAESQKLQQQTLTDLMIKKMFIEKWDGKLPTTNAGDAGLIIDLGK